MKRRQALKKIVELPGVIWALGFFGVVSAMVSACGPTKGALESTTPTPTPTPSGDCLANGTGVSIAGNHGHAMTVSIDDINAGAQKVYDITAGAGHTHTVTVTAAHFSQLAANTQVTITSSTTGHNHSVTVSCV